MMRVRKRSGAVTTLASAKNGPAGIAVDRASVYWVTYDAVMKTLK
jgi:hypothetical protein